MKFLSLLLLISLTAFATSCVGTDHENNQVSQSPSEVSQSPSEVSQSPSEVEDLVFNYPPLRRNSIHPGLYPINIAPFANQINLVPTPSEITDRVGTFSIENNGSQVLNNPFFYSPFDLNISDLEVLKYQVKALSNDPEDQIKYLWNLITNNVDHYCAAGDIGYFARSPINLLNSYGFGCCDQSAVALGGLAEMLGYPSRQVAFDGGGGHSVIEIYYHESWHLFDTDKKEYFFNSSNSIASFEELITSPDLIWAEDWNELIHSTTQYWLLPISHESRENSDFSPLTAPSINLLTISSIPFDLFPQEKVAFFTDSEGMEPAKLAPYPDYGPPPNYAKGIFYPHIRGNTNDPRVLTGDDSLYIYLFGAFPLRGGNIEITLNNFFDEEINLEIIKGQREGTQYAYSLNSHLCTADGLGTCHVTLNVKEVLNIIAAETTYDYSYNDDFLGWYPFLSMPQYYLRIFKSSKMTLNDFQQLTGQLTFQVSRFIFPLIDQLDSYVYRDLNPSCEKNILVNLDNRRVFQVNTPLSNTPSCEIIN